MGVVLRPLAASERTAAGTHSLPPRSGRLRVAVFTDTPRLGGAERVLEQIARAAVQAGHDVVLLAPQPWLLEHTSLAVPGLSTIQVGGDFRSAPSAIRRSLAAGRQLPGLARALRSAAPDVLHVSNGGYPGSALNCLALPIGALVGIRRRILTVHATPRPRAESLPALQALLDLAVWRATDVVVGASEHLGRRLGEVRGLPAGRYARIPYGVAEPRADGRATAARAAHGAPDDRLFVGMVSATSDEQKGHAVFVEALAQAPEVYGVIVGSAPAARALALIDRRGLADRLRVAGQVNDIGALLHAIDALVVPSIADESLPLVVLEAMAAGKPVLASRLSGIPEAVEDGVTGRLFQPGDAAALAALLGALAEDQEPLLAWGEEARRKWERDYTVDVMCAAYMRLYEGG